jgi:hypothetical protein
MLLNKRLFYLFILLFLCLVFCSACSSQGHIADEPKEEAGETEYLQVFEDNTKTWFFLANSVQLYVEEESEPVIEVLVRIDYKRQRVKEIVLWYVRVEEPQYKATRTDSYDQDEGFVLDS